MLSETASRILGLIAEGRSYDQILQQHPDLTYFDIFAAAREALDVAKAATKGPTHTEDAPLASPEEPAEPAHKRPKRLPTYIGRARGTHRRAWARWTREEDSQLTSLFQRGCSRAEMVQALGRQPGAIRSRLIKLGLFSDAEGEDAPTDDLSPGEDARVTHLSPDLTERRNRPDPESALPDVPGWELFRDRLGGEPPAP